jgi:hypothetical protein
VLCDLISFVELSVKGGDKIIVAGDFNGFSMYLDEFVMSNNSTQLVDFATRHQRPLDLILTNTAQFWKVPTLIAPLSSSDHGMVLLHTLTKEKPAVWFEKKRIVNRTASDLFSSRLAEVDWSF